MQLHEKPGDDQRCVVQQQQIMHNRFCVTLAADKIFQMAIPWATMNPINPTSIELVQPGSAAGKAQNITVLAGHLDSQETFLSS